MLTPEEKKIVLQVKAQGWTADDAKDIIHQYRAKQSSITAPTQAMQEAKKPIFQDTRANEWVLEQWVKALGRGIADTAQFAVWGAEQAARGVLNVWGRIGATAGQAIRKWLEWAWVNVPTVEGIKPWEPMKENIYSNLIGAGKEAAIWDKSFWEAYREANQADVERYGNQGIGWDILDIGTGIRKAGTAAVAPWATAAFSVAANAPWLQYIPQGISAATMAPVNYADEKLGLWLSEGTKENIAFNAWMWLTKPFGATKIGEKTGLDKYHQANEAVMSPIVKPIKKAWESIADTVKQWWEGVKTAITRELPVSIVERDIKLTPTERSSIEWITGQRAWDFILKHKLPKEPQAMADSLGKIADENYNGITKYLSKIDERIASQDAKKMLATMSSEMKLSDILKSEYPEYIAKIDDMVKQSDYSLSELNAVRRDFDRIIGSKIYDAKGRVSWKEDQVLEWWRNNLSDQIQQGASKYGLDIKNMNDDLRTSLTLRNGVLRSASQNAKNNLIGLQDMGIWAILSAGNPFTATGVILAKKWIESALPSIAQKVYNLNKKQNVRNNMRRGNPISPNDTTNGFSIAHTPNRRVRRTEVKLLNAPSEKTILRKQNVEQSKKILNEQKEIEDIIRQSEVTPRSKVINPSSSVFSNKSGFISPSAMKESITKIIPRRDKEARQFYDDLIEAWNSPIVAQRETAKQFGTLNAISASRAGTIDLSKWWELYHWSNSIRELKDFDLDISMQKAKQWSWLWWSFAEWPWIYLTSSKHEAQWYWPKVSTFKTEWANIISKDTDKSLSTKEINQIIDWIDKNIVDRAILDFWSKKDLIDSIKNWWNTYDQLMEIWASIFNHQNPKWYVNAVKNIWIDWLEIPKEWTKHYVVYNPEKFTSSKTKVTPKKTKISPSATKENNSWWIKVYKWVNWEWTWKKFPLDYFTTDKKSASQYGKNVIETTIYPKKMADFLWSSDKSELRKILRDNLDPRISDEFIDRALNWKDSFSNPLYEMIENKNVTKALKDAWYDSVKYLDFWNKNSKFARHETIAMLDVKPIENVKKVIPKKTKISPSK